jgi:sugar phosphate isomerase/epimerase
MIPRFACADFTFPLLAHDQALDLIALLGFEGVDIGLFQDRSHLQPADEFKDVGKSAHRLRRQLADRGLQPADIFLQAASDFMSLAANHPEAQPRARARDLFLRTLEYTVVCGGTHISGLPGVYFPEEPRATSFARCVSELAWRCEQAQAAGVTFAVEAHVGSIVPHPAAALRLLQATPGLTLTLDYTHFTRRGVPDERVEPLIAYASHFHARGARKGRLQAAVKDSTIDYARIVTVMKRTGYRGYLGIEYTWNDWEHCNEVDNLSESILLRELLRNAWGD